MNQEKIGKFILECRKKKGLTQSELAEKLGVTDKSISNWENGRNMPDLSLFKPLCDELDITINELMSGKKIDKENYQKILEENIISTIDYSNKKINEKNNVIANILIIFGILISIIALTMFKSESSWSSIFSIIGSLIFLIGIGKTIRKSFIKKGLIIIGFFVLYYILLVSIDFLGVLNIHQAPRFSITITSLGGVNYYDTLFYDVVRCDVDEENETFNIVVNKNYSNEELFSYCREKRVNRFKDIINNAKVSLVVLSKQIDYEEDASYTLDVNNRKHKIVKYINDEQSISNIINVLKNANYPQNINLIGYTYLFQLYDNQGYLILEFRQNEMSSFKENIGVSFNEKELNILKSFYKDA